MDSLGNEFIIAGSSIFCEYGIFVQDVVKLRTVLVALIKSQ